MPRESQTALERARALVDLGCTLRRVHRSRDAREPLRRGLDLAERCGAAELAGRAMREVTAAGARPAAHRAARARGAHSARAADRRARRRGKSNREIAEALFVTVKTVEWHLKHSYGKLGISSRRELAAALGRQLPPGRPGAPADSRRDVWARAREGKNRSEMRDRAEATQGLVRCGRYTPESRGGVAARCNETKSQTRSRRFRSRHPRRGGGPLLGRRPASWSATPSTTTSPTATPAGPR